MIEFTVTGSSNKTEAALKKMISPTGIYAALDKYGAQGVAALKRATPVDTQNTANQWSYTSQYKNGSYMIIWGNSNVNDGQHIAVLLQYGHATGNGGYVQGRDYINPAIQPIFDQIAAAAWKEVTSA